MNELANELIKEIVLLGEAGKKPAAKKRALKPGESSEHPGYYHRGAGYYSNVSKDGPVTHKTDDTGKMVALSQKEKAAKNKDVQQPEQPERIGSRTGQVMGWDTKGDKISREQIVANIDNKIKSLKDETKREALTKLKEALVSGDVQALRTLIANMGLEIGTSRALKARRLEKQDITNKDTELTRQIYDLAKEMGVEIPGVSSDDAETDEPSVSANVFKPQNVFPKQTKSDGSEEIADIEELPDGTGIRVEGRDIQIIDDAAAKAQEEEFIAYARRTGRITDATHELKLREYIRARIATHNHNIEYWRELARNAEKTRKDREERKRQGKKDKEKSDPLAIRQFEGEEGKKQIVDSLGRSVNEHVPEERREAVTTALEEMAAATKPREFNAAYAKFKEAIKGTPASGGMKYIAECISALRAVAFGGVAIVPQGESFELADVLCIRTNPFTGEAELQQILVEYDEGLEVTTAGSVKFGESESDHGAAGKNLGKIKNSRFNTGKVDGVDCSKVKEDLMDMASDSLRKRIFNPERDDVDPQVKKEMMGHIKKYGNIIKAYFGLPDNTTDEQIYEFLSYGRKLVCFENDDGSTSVQPTPDHKPDGARGEPFAQARLPNGEQWRIWSVLGMVTEAVHNRTVQQQFYRTEVYGKNAISEADGWRRFGKMQFQAVRKPKPVPGRPGSKKPDMGQGGWSIPSTPEETRDGNPCTTGDKRVRPKKQGKK